ncbi:hypothetical protein G7Y89_g11912 [Cudoniella acicularis]|uniref:Rhodopsin domain-containing protein n=1 Tax=Cudoniella acicularis TaxID=354080 RepID=A0A8H4VXF7_9HELO|nr:hypothetical protein G7Y89_g11912 [Cudoniella acicularis]
MADSLDHGNLQGQGLAITLAFPIVATIAVGLRLFSRSMTRTFGIDDWFIVLATVLYWAETYTTYASKYGYVTEVIYVPILALIKISIMCFLLRLTGQKLAVKRAIWALMIVTTIITLINLPLVVFQCVPVSSIWDKTILNPTCVNFTMVTNVFAAFSIVTDGLTLTIPTWIVYDLQINRRQKIMLVGVLSFGLITVISGIVRLVLLQNWSNNTPADFTYTTLFCISTIETGLACTAACAPYMKPLLMQFLPRLFGSTRYGKSSRRNSRMGVGAYELSDHRSRNGQGYDTRIEAGGFDAKVMGAVDKDGENAGGIVMVKETEIKWQDVGEKSVKNATSTESLV